MKIKNYLILSALLLVFVAGCKPSESENNNSSTTMSTNTPVTTNSASTTNK